MEYTKTNWKDLPDTSTPITADRLNNLENGVEYLFENGTMPLKKLWENENVESSFSQEIIRLSSDDYDYLIWVYRLGTPNNTSNKNFQKSQFVLKGAGVLMDAAWEASRETNITYVADYARIGKYVQDTIYGIKS